MVSDTVMGALVGGGVALLGSGLTAGINYYRTKQQLETENERRHAEFFLDKKVDALSEVHVNLARSYDTLGVALQNPGEYSWSRVQDELLPKIDSLQNSISMSSIFLTKQQESTLRSTVERYYAIADEIALLENVSREDLNEIHEATDKAKQTLAAEINEPIQRFERGNRSKIDGEDEGSTEGFVEPRIYDSQRRKLAQQKEKTRDIFRIRQDGSINFLTTSIAPDGHALYLVIARRLAYEGEVAESPNVSREELVPLFGGSEAATDVFLGKADRFLTDVGSGKFRIEVDQIPEAIEWARNYVRDDSEQEE
jgi:hypothetical protein